MFKTIFRMWLEMWRSLPLAFRLAMIVLWLAGLTLAGILIRVIWHFVSKYW